MKKLLTLLVYLFLSLSSAQYEFTCEGLGEFGRGELGAKPEWAVPYCTGDAETTESIWAASFDDIVFMQSYEALLDLHGGAAIAEDIQQRMIEAGYHEIASENTEGSVMTFFNNTKTKTSYTVMLREKEVDYYLLLVKTQDE